MPEARQRPETTRILVVDDVEQWRKEIRNYLMTQPELRVVAEVSNGQSAIREAAQLQPDLVLLDIGLPDMSGIDVAERIREVAPRSKIMFVSLMDDADSANKLVDNGALGYVLKGNLASELLPAVNSVRAGGRYISKQLDR